MWMRTTFYKKQTNKLQPPPCCTICSMNESPGLFPSAYTTLSPTQHWSTSSPPGVTSPNSPPALQFAPQPLLTMKQVGSVVSLLTRNLPFHNKPIRQYSKSGVFTLSCNEWSSPWRSQWQHSTKLFPAFSFPTPPCNPRCVGMTPPTFRTI